MGCGEAVLELAGGAYRRTSARTRSSRGGTLLVSGLIFALILRHVRRSRISPRDESLNARLRKVIDARGHFPNEQPAMKAVYPAVPSLDPKRHRTATLDHT